MNPTVGFLLALLLGLVAAPMAADAQHSPTVPRVAILRPAPPSPEVAKILEGQSVAIDFRFPKDHTERLSDIAHELVRQKPDVMFAAASSGVDAVRKATTTIPIVALDLETDPLASGMVASLARPGGNVTGVFLDFPELSGKWLELLKLVTPKVSRVAVIWDPATGQVPLKGAEAAAPSLRLQLQIHRARGPSDFEEVFRAATRARAESILVLSSPIFNTYRRTLVQLAAKHRLPAVMPFPFLRMMADSSRMDRTWSTCIGRVERWWGRYSKALSPRTSRWNGPTASCWSSIRKPRRPSTSPFPHRSSTGRIG